MGAVDLVVQVEAPPSVATGLQRVGRAGHQVGAVSRGVVFPKYRGDLRRRPPSSCERMRDRRDRGAAHPAQPARRAGPADRRHGRRWTSGTVDDLLATRAPGRAVRRRCPQSAFEAVLDMLAGRYPSDDVRRAAPAHRLGPRHRHARRRGPARSGWPSPAAAPSPTAGCSACSSPAPTARPRGSASSTRRWSTSPGSATSSCSAPSSWRIEDITHDRVLVSPAPGQPGRLPFWKGDAPGRPLELGRAIGAFVRDIAAADARRRAGARPTPASTSGRPATCSTYLAEQRAATGHLPDDRTIVRRAVPRRARRLAARACTRRSAPRVNAPWALVDGGPPARTATGSTRRCMHADDGIVLRLPGRRRPRGAAGRRRADASTPDEVERSSPRRSAARRCSRPGSASAPPARCCCPAATRAGARRCGSSGSAPPSCSRSPREYG